MGLLISIFGPDGSGKSTQARLVAQQFSESGYRVDFVWIKAYHTLAYVVSRIMARLAPHLAERNKLGTIVRLRGIARGPLGRMIWSWLELVSLLPLVLLRVFIPLKLGHVVIADRYVVDSIASVSYSMDDPAFQSRPPARVMLRLIPRNALLVYLHCSPEDVADRRGPTADSKAFLRFQDRVYQRLATYLGALDIDTSAKSIEETAEIIREQLPVRIRVSSRNQSTRG